MRAALFWPAPSGHRGPLPGIRPSVYAHGTTRFDLIWTGHSAVRRRITDASNLPGILETLVTLAATSS